MPLFHIPKRTEKESSSPTPGFSKDGQKKSSTSICIVCPRRLHQNDMHLKCYECLGPYHVVNSCVACAKLSSSARYKRKKAINYYFEHKKWPETLEAMGSDSSFVTAKTKVTQQGEGDQEDQHSNDAQIENAENNLGSDMTSDLPENQEAEEQNEQIDEDVVVVHGVEVHAQPSGPEVGNDIMAQFQEFIRSQESKKKNPPKRSGEPDASAPDPKNPRYDLSGDPIITSLQSKVSNVDQKLELILSKLSDQGTGSKTSDVQPPVGIDGTRPKELRTQSNKTVRSSSSLKIQDLDSQIEEVEEVDKEDDSEVEVVEEDPYEETKDLPPTEEVLSRRAARDMWLVALPEVCPDLPTPKVIKPSEKNKFFKTLKQKKDHPIMPFIDEVSELCVSVQKNKTAAVLKSIDQFYETEEQVEAQLLAIRSVPSALSKEVPQKFIKEPGASEANIRLDPNSKMGTQEKLCLESAKYAQAYLRLTNNFQLALTSLEKQLENCKLQADLLGSKPFSKDDEKHVVQEAMEDMLNNFNVMSLAVKDLNQANGDFVQAVAHQYRSSTQGRADAWIEAAALPKGIKKELGKFDLDQPTTLPSVEPLKVISSGAESLLTTFVEDRKDRTERAVLVKSLRGQSNRGGRGRARGQSRPRYRSPLASQSYQRFQEFTKPQTSWGNSRGRGRARGNQRGNMRGTRGRGRGQNQPFSSATGKSGEQ